MINPEIKQRNINSMLIKFYSERSQPQHLVWSTEKLIDIRAVGSEGWKDRTMINYKFEGIRGGAKKPVSFTFADLPLMNPFDWLNIL